MKAWSAGRERRCGRAMDNRLDSPLIGGGKGAPLPGGAGGDPGTPELERRPDDMEKGSREADGSGADQEVSGDMDNILREALALADEFANAKADECEPGSMSSSWQHLSSDTGRMARPENYIECFIAEQNLVSVAIGAGCRNRTIPFVSTFAAFFTRAFDQLRTGAISQTNITCAGSHCGVSIGEDGPSQMALEDLAMFRAIPGSTVFYPSDAVSCERACELAATRPGICFIRTSRPATPVIYDNGESMQIGQAKVVKQSGNDQVLVIGAGITLHNALSAAEHLAGMGVHVRVLDTFTVKPLDVAAIRENAKQCGGRVLTVEDHYPAGGLGEAVCSALSLDRDIIVKKLNVEAVPRSGPSNALMDMFGISSSCIVKGVQDLVKL